MKLINTKTSLLLTLMALCFSAASFGQYGNEWIELGKKYYKFKVGKDGLYRISKSQLDQIGLGNEPGSKFTIFKNGQKLPIYVTSNSTFDNNDYIEFYAEKNNGQLEKELYYNQNHHPTDAYSLITDTSVYFLATGTGNPRIQDVVNNGSNPNIQDLEYFWYDAPFDTENRPRSFFLVETGTGIIQYSSLLLTLMKVKGSTTTSHLTRWLQ